MNDADEIIESYRRTVAKLTNLLREAREHCVGEGLECCGRGAGTAYPGPPECCGEPIDLADRIGLALTMLEPCDPGLPEVSQS